jgi:Glyoxalase superfamily protein
MRDFRDAKTMARTLRAALAAKGLKITISQSLELIAEVFGVADWNTLAAAIRRAVPHPRYPSLRSGQDTAGCEGDEAQGEAGEGEGGHGQACGL